jgi:hypothetical protein
MSNYDIRRVDGLRKTMKKISQDNQFPDQDFSPRQER